ncbi:hypothetical protein VTK56DRAFT_6097 [Thermocarpiscus australiensis]
MTPIGRAGSQCAALGCTLRPTARAIREKASRCQVQAHTRLFSATAPVSRLSSSCTVTFGKLAARQPGRLFPITAMSAPGIEPSKEPAPLRASACIILLSPTNQVLLLHRVGTSNSFASAHVFPGGTLSAFHDGPLPLDFDRPERHVDHPAYRLAAIRETFEESGILLARKLGSSRDEGLLRVGDEVRKRGRKLIHNYDVRFTGWLKDENCEPDVENLIPFTRWITPPGMQKGSRFATQMYLYMLPLSDDAAQQQHDTPTHDGGLEHTAAAFDDAHAWLAKARAGEVILFPPQYYLLHLLAEFLRPPPPSPSPSPSQGPDDVPNRPPADYHYYQAQRDALLAFVHRVPTTRGGKKSPQDVRRTYDVPWARKCICPEVLFVRESDGRAVLALDGPGPGPQVRRRGGDYERVMLVRFEKKRGLGMVPRDLEVRWREEVMREWKEEKRARRRRDSAESKGEGDAGSEDKGNAGSKGKGDAGSEDKASLASKDKTDVDSKRLGAKL